METRKRAAARALKSTAAAQLGRSGAVDSRKAELELPYGRSIFLAVAAADGSTMTGAVLSVLCTALALLALPFLPTALAALSDGSWDTEHSVSFRGDDLLYVLLRDAAGLTESQVRHALLLTLGACGVLLVADIVSEFCPETIRWPASWNCDNRRCYWEMFCEPTREGCLVRRAGNCYSNAIYLFTSLVVSFSAYQQHEQHVPNAMACADAMFGVMLFALAVSSVIWHASNAPKSQYIDLWSMDSCIVYLILRISCLGMKVACCSQLGVGDRASKEVTSISCAALYALVVARNARHQWASHKMEYLDGGCPFSLRNRLRGLGGSRGSLIQKPPSVRGVCLFLGMPIAYMLVPGFVMWVTHAPGSVVAGTLMLVSLVLGWSWRMLERWAIDGCAPMNLVDALRRRWLPTQHLSGWRERTISLVLTTLAACVSPTAVLHLFTGATLLFGYVMVRSIDSVLMQ